MEKFQQKYRVSSARWQDWDYGTAGYYFVTICTRNRVHYFGKIVGCNQADPMHQQVETRHISSPVHDVDPQPDVETRCVASLQATEIGRMAEKYWLDIPKYHSYVHLDAFVVMPNHVHGLLHFDNPDHHPWQNNKFGPQSQNLASVIRGYKSAVTTYARKNKIEFAWQPRYHDSIIRGEENIMRVQHYIIQNPIRWWLTRPSDV